MTEIWTPRSHEDRRAAEARKAVKEYDPNLDFGLNTKTGQWCVFLRRGTMPGSADHDLPILGFSDIPSHDQVKKRLYQTDALRRGHEILDDIDRRNREAEKIREAPRRDKDGQVAEAFEWGFRKMGSEKTVPRVYMPGKGIEKDVSAD